MDFRPGPACIYGAEQALVAGGEHDVRIQRTNRQFVHPQAVFGIHGCPGAAGIRGFDDFTTGSGVHDGGVGGVDFYSAKGAVQHALGEQYPILTLVCAAPEATGFAAGI